MKTLVSTNLVQSIMAKEAFVRESTDDLLRLADWIRETFADGGKLLIFGNGGSAADAQHLAAEFVNRFLINRRPLPALALTTDSSVLTAIGNDFSFDQVFVKQVQALGRPEDLALGISTSGTSANVVKGMQAAREIGMRTAALTGGTVRPGGDLAALCDLVLNVPADSTPHIQETHLWIEHVLCEIVEKQLFGSA
ncbi:MAG: D-sedoheptulose 7-phosphate isomerase [Desulfobulbus sp.]|uniref:D-sedoheptulose-7-phosphate isomerase n=1 Tax=uncultured Desulfobulbus sp. TaxID=239745 RepID=UPI001B4975E6|nr:D-sedoheptulose 7-phosphate isomerase [uncultured Desulfobulbus sp.]MBP7516430.1 D-sedoheptulose 7-phosphate isomerase [Desulfobulbus sp.]